jgi:hypothetical protein
MPRFTKIAILIAICICNFIVAQVSNSGCYISGALIDPASTAGCGNNGTNNYCNLASLYVPAFSPTACGTSTTSGGVNHTKLTVYVLPAGCTATVTAEFKKRNYLGVGATATGCSNSGMDAGAPDALYISQSGGVVTSQSSTIDINAGTCSAYPSAGSYTTAGSNLNQGCSNADGTVQMILTGGTVSIGGASNRADEIITFTVNMSGTCGPSCSAVLPIELMSFLGEVKNESVVLSWKVASEQNVDHYLIEKSSDGEHWQKINSTPASNSIYATNVSYRYSDHYPEKGVNYYRLTNIDTDTKAGAAKVIAVNYHWGSVPFWIEQTEQELVIHLREKTQLSALQLLDNSGKLVLDTAIDKASQDIHFQKLPLPKGMYILQMVLDDKLLHRKVIIY